MKKTKIFFTLLFSALIMLFAFTLTAFADEKEHTITFDGNGHGEAFEVKIADGESFYDYEMALVSSSNSEDAEKYKELNSALYAEVDEDGIHYKVNEYFLDKEGTEEFDTRTPVTEDITVYAQWEMRIDKIELTITPPVDGTKVETPEHNWQGQTNLPEVTVPENAHYHLERLEYDEDDPAAFWMKGKNGSPFNGTFEAGKNYYAIIWVVADDGYYYKYDEVTVTVNNATYLADSSEIDTNAMIIVEVTAVEATKEEKMPEANEKPKNADTDIPYTGKTENPAVSFALVIMLAIPLTYISVRRKKLRRLL